MEANSQSCATNYMIEHEQSRELEGKAVSPLRSAPALHSTEPNRCGLAGRGSLQISDLRAQSREQGLRECTEGANLRLLVRCLRLIINALGKKRQHARGKVTIQLIDVLAEGF